VPLVKTSKKKKNEKTGERAKRGRNKKGEEVLFPFTARREERGEARASIHKRARIHDVAGV